MAKIFSNGLIIKKNEHKILPSTKTTTCMKASKYREGLGCPDLCISLCIKIYNFSKIIDLYIYLPFFNIVYIMTLIFKKIQFMYILLDFCMFFYEIKFSYFVKRISPTFTLLYGTSFLVLIKVQVVYLCNGSSQLYTKLFTTNY